MGVPEKITWDSWLWRKLLKLCTQDFSFVKTKIGDGLTTHFWSDNLTKLGPLINLTGANGPWQLGVLRNAKVVDVVDGTHWKFRRSKNQTFQSWFINVDKPPIPNWDAGSDCLLWKQNQDHYESRILTEHNWDQIYIVKSWVSWHRIVCFDEAIPVRPSSFETEYQHVMVWGVGNVSGMSYLRWPWWI